MNEKQKKKGMKDIEKQIYTVSDLNIYVKSKLRRDRNIQDIWIKGEISNFNHHKGRHMYFVLKDEESELDCAMFSSDNKELEFNPEEGAEVLCRGNIDLYKRRGKYQLVVKEMVLKGVGKLYLAYKKLKEKLKEEGLFAERHKKEIPYLPKKVGVVTSEAGAALRDIMSVLKRRFPNIDIVLSPTPVQGEDADVKIVEAIKRLDKTDVDVMIVSRGGGSIEDLWNFNKENVSRSIFACEKPVISAVGHETDFLISDFIADHRAPTPSAAAEKAVPLKEEILADLERYEDELQMHLKGLVREKREKLKELVSSRIFQRPEILLEEKIQDLDEIYDELCRDMERVLDDLDRDLANQSERLKALGPIETLERGYSVVQDEQGEVLTTVDEVTKGDKLNINMADGEIKVKVSEVIRSEKK